MWIRGVGGAGKAPRQQEPEDQTLGPREGTTGAPRDAAEQKMPKEQKQSQEGPAFGSTQQLTNVSRNSLKKKLHLISFLSSSSAA